MLNFCKRFITFSVCFFFAHAAFSAGAVECKINKAIVRSNQTVLQDLGIYNSNIDGLAGPSYRKAVDKAEKILGKRADGAKRCLNPAERQVLISVFDAKKRGAQCGKLYSPLEIETLYHTLKKGKLTKRRLSDFENVGALIWSIDEASRLETQLAGEKYYETQQNSARDCRLDKAEIESLLGASVITEVAGFENTEGQKRENSTPTIRNTFTQTELIIDHSKNYSFDPYDCALQLNIRSKVKTEQVIFYYQPERKKYVARVSLALSSFRKLKPSDLTFSSLEGSYCSPTAAVDKTFNVNGADSIEFPNISLTEIKVEETKTSKKEKPETSSTSTKSSLFDILMPEQSQGSIDQSGDEIAKLRRRIIELERQLEGVRSDSLAAKADFQKQLTKAAEVILKVESERDLAQAKLQNLSDRINAALAKAAAE